MRFQLSFVGWPGSGQVSVPSLAGLLSVLLTKMISCVVSALWLCVSPLALCFGIFALGPVGPALLSVFLAHCWIPFHYIFGASAVCFSLLFPRVHTYRVSASLVVPSGHLLLAIFCWASDLGYLEITLHRRFWTIVLPLWLAFGFRGCVSGTLFSSPRDLGVLRHLVVSHFLGTLQPPGAARSFCLLYIATGACTGGRRVLGATFVWASFACFSRGLPWVAPRDLAVLILLRLRCCCCAGWQICAHSGADLFAPEHLVGGGGVDDSRRTKFRYGRAF